MQCFGMPQCRDRSYGVAAALTYWAFLCKHREQTPAKGYETWAFLGKAIKQAAVPSVCLEQYLEVLCQRLVVPNLRPAVLLRIVQPDQVVLRVSVLQVEGVRHLETAQVQSLDRDQNLPLLGWRDLLAEAQADGFGERQILQLCKTQPHIIEVICRLKHTELFGEKPTETAEETFVEVEALSA